MKTKTFKDFREAMAWVNQVAALSERLDHHPDIQIRWNRVTLRLTTHDAGGLTSKDEFWAESEVLLAADARGGGGQRHRVQSF